MLQMINYYRIISPYRTNELGLLFFPDSISTVRFVNHEMNVSNISMGQQNQTNTGNNFANSDIFLVTWQAVLSMTASLLI